MILCQDVVFHSFMEVVMGMLITSLLRKNVRPAVKVKLNDGDILSASSHSDV